MDWSESWAQLKSGRLPTFDCAKGLSFENVSEWKKFSKHTKDVDRKETVLKIGNGDCDSIQIFKVEI